MAIAAAVLGLAATGIAPRHDGRVIQDGSSDAASVSDMFLFWKSPSGSAKAQTIPACVPAGDGARLTIVDAYGDAGVNNITITPASGTVNGVSSYVLTSNNASAVLACDGSGGNWRVLPTMPASGPGVLLGVLADVFKAPGDPDDTASLARAAMAGMPILLGARTYAVNNFAVYPSVHDFDLHGVPGRSVIQRTSFSGTNSFTIGSANVVIDGVTFDWNTGALPSASQWGLLFNAGGQKVIVRNSVLKNNTGAKGSALGGCLALLGTGPAAGGSFEFQNNEVANCGGSAAVLFGSVTAGDVSGNYIHDNSTVGISVTSYLAPSSTNLSTNILVHDNRVFRNGTAVFVGGFGPPYSFGEPPATQVQVNNNHFQDNTAYQLTLQGDHLTAIGNLIDQSASRPRVFGGIDCNSRYNVISNNVITLDGADFGIDCGGAVGQLVTGNVITLAAGAALDAGGNADSKYENNLINLSNGAEGLDLLEVESDGYGRAFPTIASNVTIAGNTFNMQGSATLGVWVKDNAGGRPGIAAPIVIQNNHFNIAGLGTGSRQAIRWVGGASSIRIDGNDVNGARWQYADPDASGRITVENVFLGGRIYGAGSSARIAQFMTRGESDLYGNHSIAYVYPTAGGAGYTSATRITASGTEGGAGFTAIPMISGGAIIGIRVRHPGSGYTGSVQVTAADPGGGSGAVLAFAGNIYPPADAKITYTANGTVLVGVDGYQAIAGQRYPLLMTAGTSLVLRAMPTGGPYWTLDSYQTPSIAIGSLPPCSPSYEGAYATVTGSDTGKFGVARCNGKSWLWPDGTMLGG